MNKLKWNKGFALEQAADDAELLQELLEIFKDSFSEDFRRIEEGFDNSLPFQVNAAAHSIKGAAASLGIQGIKEVATAIEEDSRAGNLEVTRKELPLLKALLNELLAL